jgi:hypothetical protein
MRENRFFFFTCSFIMSPTCPAVRADASPAKWQTYVSLLVATIAWCLICTAVFWWNKYRYARMNVRSRLLQVFLSLAMVLFALGELLPRLTIMPCWLVNMICLSIVPAFGGAQVCRFSTFINLTRLNHAIVKHGALITLDDEDFKETWMWRAKTLWSAVFQLVRSSDALNIKASERLDTYRTLRFVVSPVGQFALFMLVFLPATVVNVIIVVTNPVNVDGCVGCVRTELLLFEFMLPVGAFFLSFGVLLSIKARNFPDRWGLVREGRVSVLILGGSIVFYVLEAAVPIDPQSPFSFLILVCVFFLLTNSYITFVQVYLAMLDARRTVANANTTTNRRPSILGRGGISPSPAVVNSSPSSSSSSATAAAGTSIVADLKESARRLDEVLSNPVLMGMFEEFLAQEFSAENLMFLRDASKWTAQYFDIAADARVARLKHLVKLYIKSSSPLAINLPHDVSKPLLDYVENPNVAIVALNADVLLHARKEIASLLEKGPISRFLSSQEFRNYTIAELVMRVA